MKTHTIELLEHNALFRDDMTDFEFNVWAKAHLKLISKKSLIGF